MTMTMSIDLLNHIYSLNKMVEFNIDQHFYKAVSSYFLH